MQYYYNLKVNINEELYQFYEWFSNDVVELLKKVPIYKISFRNMSKMINNKVKLLNMPEENDILFTDGYNSLLVEFDDNGKELGISKLLISDELDVMEIAYDMMEESIDLELLEKRNAHILRQDEVIKRYLSLEYRTLLEDKNINKMCFLYYERFMKKNKDLNKMYQDLISDLSNDILDIHYELYKMVILSYKKALKSA